VSRRPLVTVLMTVRNGEAFIEECLQSILGQTYENFCFLILDNASTDATREIVERAGDSRIRLVALERDLGQTGALNKGLELCESEYVARTDVDDLSRPRRLEAQIGFLEAHPEVALVGTWYEVVDAELQPLSLRQPAVEHGEIAAAMLFRNQFAHSSVAYRKQAAVACGGYNPGYRHAQDYSLWWELILAHKGANLPEFLVQIRAHAAQFTRGFSAELADEPLEVVERVLNDARLPPEAVRLKRRARAYADLRYSAFASALGRRRSAYYHLGKGLLQCPSLGLTKDGSYFVARAALGETLVEALQRTKRRTIGRGRKLGLSERQADPDGF
jgi:glycosyltransferase involved in cell wall biosynthesis